MSSFLSVNKRSDLLLFNDNTIITASESMIAIYDLSWNILKILKGHTETVNAICLLGNIIVSGGQDKSIRIWWENSKVVNVDDAVVAMNAFTDNQQSWLAVAMANSSLRVFKIAHGENVEEFQKINLGSELVLAIVMGKLPGSDLPIIITGGSDKSLGFYILNQDSDQFIKVAKLKGHGDWIKSIDLMVNKSQNAHDELINDGDLMIASASQDGFIRLWRLSPESQLEENILNTKATLIKTQDHK